MTLARLIRLALILAATTSLTVGCGEKPTPTTGPEAPKAPGVPPGGP